MGDVVGEVVVVAVLTAKPGRERELEEALRGVVGASHEEPGCVRYALHRGADDPAKLVTVERWSSRDALDEHLGRPHMQGLAVLGELVGEAPVMVFCDPLPEGDPVKGVL